MGSSRVRPDRRDGLEKWSSLALLHSGSQDRGTAAKPAFRLDPWPFPGYPLHTRDSTDDGDDERILSITHSSCRALS